MTKDGKAVIAKLNIKGANFEILVDCEKALDFKHNKPIDISDVLIVPTVFKDSKKGEKASTNKFKENFGTENVFEIAKKIIKKGTVQITVEYRKKLIEEKKKTIINIIAKNAIDPRTNLPHPPSRIELALDQIKLKIDPFKQAEEQINEIINLLKPIIPISFQKRKIKITFQPRFSSMGYGILKKFGQITNDKWNNNGSRSCTVEIPAGFQEELTDKINKLTRGEAEIIVEK